MISKATSVFILILRREHGFDHLLFFWMYFVEIILSSKCTCALLAKLYSFKVVCRLQLTRKNRKILQNVLAIVLTINHFVWVKAMGSVVEDSPVIQVTSHPDQWSNCVESTVLFRSLWLLTSLSLRELCVIRYGKDRVTCCSTYYRTFDCIIAPYSRRITLLSRWPWT